MMANTVLLNLKSKITLAIAGTVAFATLISTAQTSPPTHPAATLKFEVASVKAADRRSSPSGAKSEGRGRSSGFEVEPKRFVATNANLFTLIVKAYGLNSCRPAIQDTCILLSGGPGWMRRDGFDIVAKMPGDSHDYTVMQFQNGQAPELQRMLQALLAERFQLKIHRENRQLPVYALTVQNKGPKFKRADKSERPLVAFGPPTQVNGKDMMKLIVRNSSMQQLTDLLSIFMDRPVLNQTGLTDQYDFTLAYEANADAPGVMAATGPGLFTALREQGGLKLEAAKGSVEVLVIDHVERPSAN